MIGAVAEFAQKAVDLLKPVVGPLVGFVSAWILFELTERRKVRLAERALRRALVAELQHAEVLLSSIIGKFAYLARTPDEIKIVADEIRWFVRENTAGRPGGTGMGIDTLPADEVTRISGLTDNQLVAVFTSAHPQVKGQTGTSIILPVVDAALGGRTTGFNSGQIYVLSVVRWQVHLLAQEVNAMSEFMRLSFTVTDPENHERVLENLHATTRGYTKRAVVVLGCIRNALRELGASSAERWWRRLF